MFLKYMFQIDEAADFLMDWQSVNRDMKWVLVIVLGGSSTLIEAIKVYLIITSLISSDTAQ